MKTYLKFIICLILGFFSISNSHAQLKMLDIKPLEKGANIDVPIYKKVEDAAIIIYSSIKGLVFTSSMNTLDTFKYYESSDKYILFVQPNQSCYINVKHITKAYFEEKIKIESLQPKEVKYYKIEPLQEKLDIKAGEFYARSVPTDALLSFEGYTSWDKRLPNTFKIPSLYYKVSVSKIDYEILDTTIYINPDKPNAIEFHLIPKFSNIQFEINPSDAKIFIDDNINSDVQNIIKVDKGLRRISIRYPHYYAFDTTIQTHPFITHIVEKNLKPIMGSLTVTSNERDAVVYISGKNIGSTPLYNYPLQEGSHTVKIKKNGFTTLDEDYKVLISENSISSKNIDMVSSVKVTIKTEPSDAKITIDDKFIGTSELNTKLGIGEHNISIKRDYFETIDTHITVGSDLNSNSFTYILRSKPINITFITRPKGVSVNGAFVNIFVSEKSKTTQAPYGQQKVVFSKDGYFSKTRNINVTENGMKFRSNLFPYTFGELGFSYGLHMASFNLDFCLKKHVYFGVGFGINMRKHKFSSPIAFDGANLDDINLYNNIVGTKSYDDSTAFCYNFKLGWHFQKPLNFIISVGYAFGRCNAYKNVYQAQHDYVYTGTSTLAIKEGEYFTTEQLIERDFKALTFGLKFPVLRFFSIGADYYTDSDDGAGLVYNVAFLYHL
ncbi:MAG: PEGA domain-containing protein [Bacteroidota bacterium]